MDDKIKWALLAIGGYFLYDWYSKQGSTGAGKYAGMCLPELQAAYLTASPEDKAIIQGIVARYKEPEDVLASMAAKGDCIAQGALEEMRAQAAAHPPSTGGNIVILPTPVLESPVPVTPLPPWHAPVYTPPAQTPAVVSSLRAMSDGEIATAAAAFNQDAIAESVRRGQRYDFHTWNWYRAVTQGVQPTPETYYGGDANDLVTAAEYMLVRRTALATGFVQGLTGLGRWGGPILPWSTAWRA